MSKDTMDTLLRQLVFCLALFGSDIALADLMDAERCVRATLAKSGLHEGYDRDGRRMIVVGSFSVPIKGGVSNKNFLAIRDACEKSAYLNAKCEIMRAFAAEVSGSATMAIKDEGESTTSRIASDFSILTKTKLPGCIALCTAESFDAQDNVYSAAAAVAWSERLREQSECAAERCRSVGSGLDVREVAGGWLAGVDLSCIVGCRHVTGSDGRSCFLGVGYVDAENATGVRFNILRDLANKKAEQNLSFELFADSVASDVMADALHEDAGAAHRSGTSYAMSFVSALAQRCKGMRIFAQPVHMAVVRNPVTGRKMIVCVKGICTVSTQNREGALNESGCNSM